MKSLHAIPVTVSMLLATLSAFNGCATDRSIGSSQEDSIAISERAEATRTIATWNTIALRTTAAGPFSPPQETRSMAMVSAAVFDAVNAIDGQYEPYVAHIMTRRDASLIAAAAAAAHRVLAALYPSSATVLDADFDSTLTHIPSGASKEAGVAAGEAAAEAVLAARTGDHAADHITYVPRNAPGMWAPTPPALLPALEAAWGSVKPFALDSGSQFRPPPPPALGSADYIRDFLEIQSVGVAGSLSRTAAQTEAARFWISTAPQLWNQVARQLTVARALDPATAARVYLLLNIAGADAMIAAWDAKFVMHQWRPVTAIRRAAADGSSPNPLDTTWTPLITTPPFPDYPAGHTVYAGAAETVLDALLGETGEVSITSATAAGATHRYSTVHAVADEVVNARVWGGVHWRTSSTVGREVGKNVGAIALARVARKR